MSAVSRRPPHSTLAAAHADTLLEPATGPASQATDANIEPPRQKHAPPPALRARRTPVRNYLVATAIIVVFTALAVPLSGRLDRTNLVMIYLMAVLFTAVRLGRGPAVLASFLGVGAFDFFFVPPHLTLAVSDTQYLVTFAVMLGSALLVSTLAVRLREQAEEARRREHRTAALYALTRDLAGAPTEVHLLEAAVARVRETFECDAVLFVPDEGGRLGPRDVPHAAAADGRALAAAQWAFDHRERTGPGAFTSPSARGVYQPLDTGRNALGVLAVHGAPRAFETPEALRLLETFARQIALALERTQLAAETARTHVAAERERLRNTLLSSVSHDLRTPLASITGATSALLDTERPLDDATRRELLQSVSDEARRLNRLVANLLEMTRVEAGGIALRTDWHSIEEVVGAALARLELELKGRALELDIPIDLPLVRFDAISIEQVLVNLLDNAAKYAPPDQPITVRALAAPAELIVEVLDRGAGIRPGEEERVFEKFYRARHSADPGGMGLGLAICRAIVQAHGGTLTVRAREGGGAAFRFTLRRDETAPSDSELAADPIADTSTP